MGSVCATSKDKEFLLATIKKLKQMIPVEIKSTLITRDNMCNLIRDILLFLEKYSTTKDGNKKTYVMIPVNHPKYSFPFNLEDRIKYILQQIKDIVDREFDHTVTKNNNGNFNDIKNMKSYIIELKKNKYLEEHKKELTKIGFIDYKIVIG